MIKYSNGFKQKIVNLFNSGKSKTYLVNKYNLSYQTISSWVNSFKEIQISSNRTVDLGYIKSIIKENEHLKKENLILKKTFSLLQN